MNRKVYAWSLVLTLALALLMGGCAAMRQEEAQKTDDLLAVPSVAIAWALAWPGVTGAIVGARTPKQVDGWAGAASITLTPQDLDEIAAAIRRTRAGAGPVEAGRPRASRHTVAE